MNIGYFHYSTETYIGGPINEEFRRRFSKYKNIDTSFEQIQNICSRSFLSNKIIAIKDECVIVGAISYLSIGKLNQSIQILNFAVINPCQGFGIGKTLIKQLQEKFPGMSFVIKNASSSSKKKLLKLGFKVRYDDGIDYCILDDK